MPDDQALKKDQFVLLVTRHGKAKAIVPPLRNAFGARVGLAMGVDTDQVRRERVSNGPLNAALSKVQAGFDTVPYAQFAIASAGSFSLDTTTPAIMSGFEVVVLAERSAGTLAVGRSEIKQPRDSVRCDTIEAAATFAASLGFPRRAVRLLVPNSPCTVEIEGQDELMDAISLAMGSEGFVLFEGDRRANRCLWRMDAIRRATEDLVAVLVASTPHPNLLGA